MRHPDPILRHMGRNAADGGVGTTLDDDGNMTTDDQGNRYVYGDDDWQATTAKELGLEHTLRQRGRPRKREEDEVENVSF